MANNIKTALMAIMLLLSAAQSVAHAETINKAHAASDKRFVSYALAMPYLEKAASFAKSYDQVLGLAQNCKKEWSFTPLALDVLQDIVISSAGDKVTGGAWTMRYNVGRCGETKTYNAIFIVSQDGRITAKPYIPGNTLANMQLVNDVMEPAKTAALLKSGAKGCTAINMFDTSVSKQASRNGGAATWSEDWDVRVCGKNYRVPIRFDATADGGVNFNISLPNVRAL